MQAHVRFEDVASFETPFAESWLRHRVCGCGKQDVGQLDPLDADLLVVLGGPIGVNDHAAYPVVTQEIELLKARPILRPRFGMSRFFHWHGDTFDHLHPGLPQPGLFARTEHFSGSRFIPSLSQHGSNTGCWDMQANWRQLASVP